MLGMLLSGVVAVIHFYIVWLEMVAWDTPKGRAAFGTTPEFSAASKVLAANQGLYNGFLAAGIVLGLLLGIDGEGRVLTLFMLACVAVAGLYGAMTVGRKILFIQTVPAVFALAAVLVGI